MLPVLLLAAVPAHAQVSATVALVSDDRLRARTVSDGEPALTADISFDDASGFYLAAGGAVTVQDGDPAIIRGHANLGYAHRLRTGNIVDVGILRTEYTEYFTAGRATHYTEFYAGLLARNVAIYARYSPDYFQPEVSTLYLDASGVVDLSEEWRLIGQAGVLTRLTRPASATGSRIGYDWRFGVGRSFGAADLEVALSDGGPADEFYQGRTHDRMALTAALTWSL